MTPATVGTNPITSLDKKRIRDRDIQVGNDFSTVQVKGGNKKDRILAGTKQSPPKKSEWSLESERDKWLRSPFLSCIIEGLQ